MISALCINPAPPSAQPLLRLTSLPSDSRHDQTVTRTAYARMCRVCGRGCVQKSCRCGRGGELHSLRDTLIAAVEASSDQRIGSKQRSAHLEAISDQRTTCYEASADLFATRRPRQRAPRGPPPHFHGGGGLCRAPHSVGKAARSCIGLDTPGFCDAATRRRHQQKRDAAATETTSPFTSPTPQRETRGTRRHGPRAVARGRGTSGERRSLRLRLSDLGARAGTAPPRRSSAVGSKVCGASAKG